MSSDYPYNNMGFWCTPVEWTNSYPLATTDFTSNKTTYSSVIQRCLTRGESVGLTVVAQSGLISLIAVCYVFFMVGVRAIRNRQRPRILQEPTDLLMISLFVADILQALGAIMDIKWVHIGNVHVGGYCDAQGIVQQLGETGVALSTLLIAIYTGSALWLNKRIESIRNTMLSIGFIWLLVAVLVIAGNVKYRHSDYQGPTPYWCWIGDRHLRWKIAGEYVWFWITLLSSVFIHVPLLCCGRATGLTEKEWSKLVLPMISYPVAYCFVILPVSIVRFIGFYQERNGAPGHISGLATFTVGAIFNLSGLVNVILLICTRPSSSLFSDDTQPTQGEQQGGNIPLTHVGAP